MKIEAIIKDLYRTMPFEDATKAIAAVEFAMNAIIANNPPHISRAAGIVLARVADAVLNKKEESSHHGQN